MLGVSPYKFIYNEMIEDPDKEELFHKDIGRFKSRNERRNTFRVGPTNDFRGKTNYFDLYFSLDSSRPVTATFYHLVPRSSDISDMTPEFFAIFNSNEFSLKRNCFAFSKEVASRYIFLRGQASITDCMTKAFAEVMENCEFTYSQKWSEMNIDQILLTVLDLDYLLDLVEENVGMRSLSD